MRFSIIMPSYNVAEFIGEAISCIYRQTYRDFELIIVDDCSTDETLSVAEGMKFHDETISRAGERPEIRIIHLDENQGVSHARNVGLAEAKGDYVLFLDPDDTYELNLLERLAEALSLHEADAVVYSLHEDYYDLDGQIIYTIDHGLPTEYTTDLDRIHLLVQALEEETMYGYPWNKAYKRSLLIENQLQYPSITHVEDILFNIETFYHVKSLYILGDRLYHYRNSGQVRLTAKYLPDYMELQKTRIQAFLKQQEEWGSLNETILSYMASFYFRSFLSMVERELTHGANDLLIMQKIEEEYRSDLYLSLRTSLRGSSHSVAFLYQPIANGETKKILRRAKAIHFVKTKHSGLYNRLKQIR